MEFDIGVAAFWIALGAVLVANGWFRLRREQMKHETIRGIVERTGQVDEAQLRKLLETPSQDWSNHSWTREPPPGGGFRAFRILGTLVIVAAVCLAIFSAAMFAVAPRIAANADLVPVFALAIAIAVFGGGVFWCSRFLPRPMPDDRARNDQS